jgi:hypothetical protein
VLQGTALQPSLCRPLEPGQRRIRIDAAAEGDEDDMTHAVLDAGCDQVLETVTVDGFERIALLAR